MAGDGGRRADLRPPAEVSRISRRLEEAGFSTWAVGGAVRDALAGRTPGDWDLTTAARPGEIRRLFRRTFPIGIEHGTVGVLGKDGKLYEVTTFRRDVESFGRKARVSFSDTVEEDLERRDFTINAVAWHPGTGEIRDPHDGGRDLREGVLRTVGEPAERFREDRLRVLRALRFAGRFGMRIDPPTWKAALAAVPALPELSHERVREELFKVLRELRRPSDSLRLYERSGALAMLYPELHAAVGAPFAGGADLWSHLLRTADFVSPRHPLVRFAALLHGAAGEDAESPQAESPYPGAAAAVAARKLLQRLRSSNAETDLVSHLVAQHGSLPSLDAPAPDWRRWLRRVGRDYARDLLRLEIAHVRARAEEASAAPDAGRMTRAGQVLRERSPLQVSELAIDGSDLRALGIPAGPLYGEILRGLLEDVTDDPALNEREALLARVRDGLDRSW